jgi:hypothetical protein
VLFKLGGEPFAKRLVSDFEILWPTEEEIQESAPGPPRIKVLQQWQDADVVTLSKHKGDPMDPSNYRQIFLLDVAGKVLASVINQRLKVLFKNPSATLNVGRQNRSTGHLIHALRRTGGVPAAPMSKLAQCLLNLQKHLIHLQEPRYGNV